PGPRRTDLAVPRPLDVEAPALVLGLHALGQIVERHRGPHPAVDLHLDAVDRDRDQASVFADSPVAVHADRLAAPGGVSNGAVLRRVWRPVRVLPVDSVVARTAEQLVVAVVSQYPDGRVVDE